jgi:cytochrome c-type biogenesis protein CcmH/NrfG
MEVGFNMKKEAHVQNQYTVIKRSTALIIAVICLVAGFLAGMFYSTVFKGGGEVRKMTVKQPTSPTSSMPRVQGPGTPVSPGPERPQTGAIAALEQQVGANPRNAEAWASLGNNYFDIDDHANAIRAYKKHLELKPGNADVWTDMGIMYRLSGRPDEAIRCFEKAIEVNPRHQQARYNKGVVLMHDLKNPEAAVKAWEELVNIYPDARTQDGTPLKELIKRFRSTSAPKK